MIDTLTFIKCLAEPTRLNAMLLLAEEGELCVCELTEALAESQPKVSRHLAQLRQCGLLLDSRDGQWVFYRLHPELPAWAKGMLGEAAAGANPALTEAKAVLGAMANRPGKRCC
ncbi:MAG: metalloregulator ArsR/SmtB family transcription factor [Pseudomonadota bacterium]|uniref:Arsenical resistance operon repressor n=1 Tax=Gallaecimonas pentaromativorans TaxID=584787 RepID=A0A3N1PL06_9GAMM|nr:metalloregulator ArsR/SmtB family transcription factor [Gallaecimonas pentaromativorans]MED5523696.1 metalloregulator ArsR/SmtB family transcription factor [Pseudomonadota bacterium]ROQ27637.1 ArsR family transcriptional regulator [Gallaecimonas pentaromativorans]